MQCSTRSCNLTCGLIYGKRQPIWTEIKIHSQNYSIGWQIDMKLLISTSPYAVELCRRVVVTSKNSTSIIKKIGMKKNNKEVSSNAMIMGKNAEG